MRQRFTAAVVLKEHQWEDAYVCSMPTSIFVEAQFTEQLMDDGDGGDDLGEEADGSGKSAGDCGKSAGDGGESAGD